MKIDTVLKNITFYNSDNGFGVVKDTEGRVFTGYFITNPKNIIGIPILIHCKKKKTKYGIQYSIDTIKYNIPPLFHFLTEIIKGVKKEAAIDLANKYQKLSNLEKALKENEEEILKIKGIGKKSLEKLKIGIEKDKSLYELAEFLLPYSVSPKIIKKIYKTYEGKNVIKKLKKNPYKVLTSVKGIGFKKADEIILKAGLVKKDSLYRAEAGIVYIMASVMNEKGDSVFSKTTIEEEFFSLFEDDFSKEKFEKAFVNLLEKEILFLIDPKQEEVCFTPVFQMEKFIFNYINRKVPPLEEEEGDILKHIEEYEKKEEIILDKDQRKAVVSFFLSETPVYIIAGYAGTGKTTTAKAVIEYMRNKGKNIVGCALSGAAANRLESVTGMTSRTIHSLLGYRKHKNKKSQFIFNEKNKLTYDLIVLDEASMVDATLFFHLLKAIDFQKTKLLMLGDDAQLPPIGWGEIFSDLLKTDIVDKTKLTKIHRQSSDKVITYFASEIRKGKVPKGYLKKGYSDFRFVPFNLKGNLKDMPPEEKKELRERNNLRIKEFILKGFEKYKEDILFYLERYKETLNVDYLKLYISRIQLISPIKNGILGTIEMNSEIKRILNPIAFDEKMEDWDYIRIMKSNNVVKYFSKFDKVIHLQNRDMFCSPYSVTNPKIIESSLSNERVYNGQVGIILNIIPYIKDGEIEETFIEVYYPNEGYYAYYTKEDFYDDIIDLSYTITVHKSQGQEYKSVIIPVTMSHFKMLDAKLLYTAVTRAKERVLLAGEVAAFEIGVKRFEEIKRKTVIKKILEKESFYEQNREKETEILNSLIEELEGFKSSDLIV